MLGKSISMEDFNSEEKYDLMIDASFLSFANRSAHFSTILILKDCSYCVQHV